jgi:hypothetical protein
MKIAVQIFQYRDVDGPLEKSKIITDMPCVSMAEARKLERHYSNTVDRDLYSVRIIQTDEEETKKEPVLWGFPDSEELHFDDPDEFIEDWLMNDFCGQILPATLELAGFKRMHVKFYWDSILEDVLEYVDDEYQSPYGDGGFEPTERMKEAAKAFAKVLEEDYLAWACEECCRKTVDMKQWCEENYPDALTEFSVNSKGEKDA